MTVPTGALIKRGSSKNIYAVPDDPLLLDFEMTDDFSVFDVGKCPQQIPGKGKALCDAAVRTFEIANTLGIPTIYRGRISDTVIRVIRAEVITDRPLTADDRGCVIPAEWIDRSCVSGSLLRAFKDGKKKPTDYGFPTDEVPAEGTPLPEPVHMFTTKFEKVDRELTREAALALCGMTVDEGNSTWAKIDILNRHVRNIWNSAGYERFDGKKEFVRALDGSIILADVACTQDEDRPVELKPLRTCGKVVHCSKEFLRQLFIENGYYDAVQAARAVGKEDPAYFMLTEEQLAECSRRYADFAAAYMAAPFS